jgi:hypothetical protein
MITPHQRHKLLRADRTRDAGWIAAVIEDLLEVNPTATLLEVEQEFRDAGAKSYLVATPERFEIVFGLPAMLAAVGAAGMTPEENRAMLAGQ